MASPSAPSTNTCSLGTFEGRERAHYAIGAFERGIKRFGLGSLAELAVITREVRNRSERHDRNGESEVVFDGREERRGVPAEARAHHADPRRTSGAQVGNEHAHVTDGLAKALVRESRIGTRKRRRTTATRASHRVVRQHGQGYVEALFEEPLHRELALFDGVDAAQVSMHAHDRGTSFAPAEETRVRGQVLFSCATGVTHFGKPGRLVAWPGEVERSCVRISEPGAELRDTFFGDRRTGVGG
jgi:hypothetical protein